MDRRDVAALDASAKLKAAGSASLASVLEAAEALCHRLKHEPEKQLEIVNRAPGALDRARDSRDLAELRALLRDAAAAACPRRPPGLADFVAAVEREVEALAALDAATKQASSFRSRSRRGATASRRRWTAAACEAAADALEASKILARLDEELACVRDVEAAVAGDGDLGDRIAALAAALEGARACTTGPPPRVSAAAKTLAKWEGERATLERLAAEERDAEAKRQRLADLDAKLAAAAPSGAAHDAAYAESLKQLLSAAADEGLASANATAAKSKLDYVLQKLAAAARCADALGAVDHGDARSRPTGARRSGPAVAEARAAPGLDAATALAAELDAFRALERDVARRWRAWTARDADALAAAALVAGDADAAARSRPPRTRATRTPSTRPSASVSGASAASTSDGLGAADAAKAVAADVRAADEAERVAAEEARAKADAERRREAAAAALDDAAARDDTPPPLSEIARDRRDGRASVGLLAEAADLGLASRTVDAAALKATLDERRQLGGDLRRAAAAAERARNAAALDALAAVLAAAGGARASLDAEVPELAAEDAAVLRRELDARGALRAAADARDRDALTGALAAAASSAGRRRLAGARRRQSRRRAVVTEDLAEVSAAVTECYEALGGDVAGRVLESLDEAKKVLDRLQTRAERERQAAEERAAEEAALAKRRDAEAALDAAAKGDSVEAIDAALEAAAVAGAARESRNPLALQCAIGKAKAAGVGGSAVREAEALLVALKRSEEAEAKEERRKDCLAALNGAVVKRDAAALDALLVEAAELGLDDGPAAAARDLAALLGAARSARSARPSTRSKVRRRARLEAEIAARFAGARTSRARACSRARRERGAAGALRSAVARRDGAAVSAALGDAYATLGGDVSAIEDAVEAAKAASASSRPRTIGPRLAEAEAEAEFQRRRQACETPWPPPTRPRAEDAPAYADAAAVLEKLGGLVRAREALALALAALDGDGDGSTRSAAVDDCAARGAAAGELAKARTALRKGDAKRAATLALRAAAHGANVEAKDIAVAEAARQEFEAQRSVTARLEACVVGGDAGHPAAGVQVKDLDALLLEAGALFSDDTPAMANARRARETLNLRRKCLQKVRRAAAVAARTRDSGELDAACAAAEALGLAPDDEEDLEAAEDLMLELHCEAEARAKLAVDARRPGPELKALLAGLRDAPCRRDVSDHLAALPDDDVQDAAFLESDDCTWAARKPVVARAESATEDGGAGRGAPRGGPGRREAEKPRGGEEDAAALRAPARGRRRAGVTFAAGAPAESGEDAAFHWTRYGALKSEDAFLEGLYSPGEKRRAADRRLRYQSTPLHASVCALDDADRRDAARACHRDVLTFCGELYHQFPNEMARDLLAKGRDDVAGGKAGAGDLADEILVQLLKHLTANDGGATSATRGWRLLYLCVRTFPPGAELLPYLQLAAAAVDLDGGNRSAVVDDARALVDRLHEQIELRNDLDAATLGDSAAVCAGALKAAKAAGQDQLAAYDRCAERHKALDTSYSSYVASASSFFGF
ncbi:hypothetical protein JL721_4399 [Aureococcus anophagefferens]|nr:hypothetical protein JL721_4399 [Aureococcus anophagefferens]